MLFYSQPKKLFARMSQRLGFYSTSRKPPNLTRMYAPVATMKRSYSRMATHTQSQKHTQRQHDVRMQRQHDVRTTRKSLKWVEDMNTVIRLGSQMDDFAFLDELHALDCTFCPPPPRQSTGTQTGVELNRVDESDVHELSDESDTHESADESDAHELSDELSDQVLEKKYEALLSRANRLLGFSFDEFISTFDRHQAEITRKKRSENAKNRKRVRGRFGPRETFFVPVPR